MTGTALDYLIVVAYFVGILAFGTFFGRYTKSTRDFFFGGQRFSWWLIAASLVATGIGSYSFIKYAQAGFVRGMSSTMTYLNDWFIIPFFMFGWLPIIYFSRIKSVPEYFERRFDRRTRVVATILTQLYLIGYIGLNFYLLGIAIRALLGVDLVYSVPIVALISAIYITAGGQTAVIFTDLVQGFFLYLAGALLLFFGLSYVGGLGEWWSGMDLAHRLPLPNFNRPADFNFAGIFWSEGIVGTIAYTFMNQGFIMRYLAIKSVNEGRKCLTFNTLILMPISAVVVGNAGWIAFSMFSKGLLPEGADTKEIFVVMASVVCKPGIFGFVIAALTAALMSTIDTLINACTAIGLFDIYQPFVKRDADDKHYLRVSRVLSVTITVLGVALVPAFAASQSIFRAHYTFVGIVTPPMVVAIFLGVLWKRFTPKAAFWSMIVGSGFLGISLLWPQVISPVAWTHGMDPQGGYPYFRALYGLLITGAFAIAITLFTKPKPVTEIYGLTIGTVQKGKELFKGGKPNEVKGETIVLHLKVTASDFPEGEEKDKVHLREEDMERLKANPGDLLYVCDSRRRLGGLRSLHVKMGAPHREGPVAITSKSLLKQGNLLADKKVRIEKIL